MNRYHVELRMKPDDPIYPNVSFYVKGWSIEQVRDMFCISYNKTLDLKFNISFVKKI